MRPEAQGAGLPMQPWTPLLALSAAGAGLTGALAGHSVVLVPPHRFVVPSSEVENALRNAEHVFFARDYEQLGGFEPSGVVVDVGAYAGFYSVRASRRSRLVVAVEANPVMCHYLRVNAKLNRRVNIVPVCAAVGGESGKRPLFIAEDMVNSSLLESYVREVSAIRGRVEVRVLTLSGVLSLLGIEHVDLLKVDVEGAEEEVIRGSSEVLEPSFVRRIVVEVHPPFCKASRIAEMLRPRYRVAVVVSDETPSQVFLYAWGPGGPSR